MGHATRFVGLDVHARTIHVAVAEGGDVGPPVDLGRIAHQGAAVDKLVRGLAEAGRPLRLFYEAGPCGYGLYRRLRGQGHACVVVAPSLIPRRSGDRVKTDRRDAAMLARLGRSGDLRGVWVPDAAHEAMRDLLRYRDDVKLAQRRWRQRLGAFLLRRDRLYRGKTRWTQAHGRWLLEQKFDEPIDQVVFQEYVEAQAEATRRLEEVECNLRQAREGWTLAPVAEALCALRGVDVLTAMTVVCELGDVTRFDSPRELMAFVGLVPSEYSSGERRAQGRITKSGNGYVRRALVGSAWSYRHPARMTRHLRGKIGSSDEVVARIAWKAQKRLCGRHHRLMARGKSKNKVNTAIARELLGFIWAVYHRVWPGLGLSVGGR